VNTQITHPTNFPSGDRRTIAVKLPAPESAAPELFQSEDGKLWRLAGTDSAGGRLFVPQQVDPAQCARWVWAKEAELVEVVGALTPVAVAA
jgi:hypothetical protein